MAAHAQVKVILGPAQQEISKPSIISVIREITIICVKKTE